MRNQHATSSARCITCGDEIVDTINSGVFRAGECALCECWRYESQKDLLEQVILIRNATESLDYEDGDDEGRMAEMERTLDLIRNLAYTAIARARSFRN